MLRRIFPSYSNDDEEDEVEVDEDAWDEAARRPILEKGEGGGEPARSLCQDCGRPLRHLAKVPSCSILLNCAKSSACTRCDRVILPGEMHFRCSQCSGMVVCKTCGPGVYVEREFDYVDSCAGVRRIKKMPDSVIHERKARTKLRDMDLVAELAGHVVHEAWEISQELVQPDGEELFDAEWREPGLLQRLLDADDDADVRGNLTSLANRAERLLAEQPTLTEANVPCKVFGDIHGQFRDMLLLFHYFGMPGSPQCPYVVFNGDFVDRGSHQLEVVTVLLSLKIMHPERVFLNRGNHEDKHMNMKYGFQAACLHRFGRDPGQQIFAELQAVFMVLPLACLIGKKVLALHGGLGDGRWLLNDLKEVQRPLTHDDLQDADNRWLWNILWSDPIEDDTVGSSVFGVHQSPRSRNAVKFGWDVTQRFCATNGVDLVIRSHQAKKKGYGFDVMHNESLIRVFSARDYEHNSNDGAVLLVHQEPMGDPDGMLMVRSQVIGSLSIKDDDD